MRVHNTYFLTKGNNLNKAIKRIEPAIEINDTEVIEKNKEYLSLVKCKTLLQQFTNTG